MSCLKYDNVTVLYRSYIAKLSPLTLDLLTFQSISAAYHSIIQIYRMSSLFLTIYIYYRMRHSLNNSNKLENLRQNTPPGGGGPEELFLRHFCKSLEMQQSIIMATLHLLRQQ